MPPGAQGQNTIHRKPVETCLVPVCVVLPSLLGVFFLWQAVCCAPLYSSRVVLRDVLLAGAQSVHLPIPPRPREEWNWVDILKVAELEPLCDMPCPSFFLCEHMWTCVKNFFYYSKPKKRRVVWSAATFRSWENLHIRSIYHPQIFPDAKMHHLLQTTFITKARENTSHSKFHPKFYPKPPKAWMKQLPSGHIAAIAVEHHHLW